MANTELIKIGVLLLVIIAISVVVLRGLPRTWIETNDGDFQTAFLAFVGKQDKWDFPMKETMSRILTAWWEKKCGGVVLQHHDEKLDVQIIEFKRGPPSKMDGTPVIGVRYTRVSTKDEAKKFLRRYPRVDYITCSDETFVNFVQHC